LADIKVKYSEDGKILIREIRGKVSFSEVYDSWLDLLDKEAFKPPLKGMINDFRGADLEVNVTDTRSIISLLLENNHIFNDVKVAVIVDSYKNIVFPMIVEKIAKEANVKPFSTFEAAKDWILGIID
jgi:hypothetical protein